MVPFLPEIYIKENQKFKWISFKPPSSCDHFASCDINSLKMRIVHCLAVLSLVACYADLAAAQNKVVCYFGSWAGYRQGNGKFTVETIDPHLCTHLIYSFVGIDALGGIRILDTWNDLNLNGIARFVALKNKNPSVKTMVAIGGWNEGSVIFSRVMASQSARAIFINNAINFVKKYNFDGFDLDWEYPAQRGGAASDKSTFALLLKEMRAKFDENGLLLSAAVAASQASVQTSYDIPTLSKYLDFINIMTYDLHGPWEHVTGQNAPLYASSLDRSAEARELNVNASVHFWLSQGAAPNKLVLGMGTYGRSYSLTTSARQLGSPSAGPGPMGPYTQEAGMLGYNEICEQQRNGGWQVSWDDEQQVPFASSGNVWVGYDDSRSIRAKSEFALSLGLGGGMIWSLETDDFLGLCTGTKFPLLSTIHDVLIKNVPATPVDPAPEPEPAPEPAPEPEPEPAPVTTTTTTTAATTTRATIASTTGATPSGLCTKEGYVRDPSNCGTFYFCQRHFNGFAQFQYKCPANLAFDIVNRICNYISQVQC